MQAARRPRSRPREGAGGSCSFASIRSDTGFSHSIDLITRSEPSFRRRSQSGAQKCS